MVDSENINCPSITDPNLDWPKGRKAESKKVQYQQEEKKLSRDESNLIIMSNNKLMECVSILINAY